MSDVSVLRLTVDEAPDPSDGFDATTMLTVMMRSLWLRELKLAEILGDRFPEIRDVPFTVELMPEVAEEAVERYMHGPPPGIPALPTPGIEPRLRRSLAKIPPYMRKRWLPLQEAAEAKPKRRKDCRRQVKKALKRAPLAEADGPFLTLQPGAMTARFMLARCRECGRCPEMLKLLAPGDGVQPQ